MIPLVDSIVGTGTGVSPGAVVGRGAAVAWGAEVDRGWGVGVGTLHADKIVLRMITIVKTRSELNRFIRIFLLDQ
jgi:carbonic anhydrase/acetyltransferase-like protein (isoleucine patch superfamily)